MQKAVRSYNERFHSTIKAIPKDVQNFKVNLEKIKENLQKTKTKNLEKANANREDYEEGRPEGFIKNYKAVRHKHLPKYRKSKLRNIHLSNIKRPLKFTVNDDNSDVSSMDNSN